MSSWQDNAVDFIWWRPFYLQCQSTGDIIRLTFLAKHFAMKTYMPSVVVWNLWDMAIF